MTQDQSPWHGGGRRTRGIGRRVPPDTVVRQLLSVGLVLELGRKRLHRRETRLLAGTVERYNGDVRRQSRLHTRIDLGRIGNHLHLRL